MEQARDPLGWMRPQLRKAFAEDALAIASLAASNGYADDAAAMRHFATALDPRGVRAEVRRASGQVAA